MPLNVLDAHYRSFQKLVLPVCKQRQIGAIGMKALAAQRGIIPRKLGLDASLARRYVRPQPFAAGETLPENPRPEDQEVHSPPPGRRPRLDAVDVQAQPKHINDHLDIIRCQFGQQRVRVVQSPVAQDVHREMARLQAELLPPDVQVEVLRDYGQTANEKVNNLASSLGFAIITVVVFIGVFLGWRPALVVGLAVPICYGITLALDMALGYKQLMRVEQAWRQLKSVVRMRPVFHWAPHRIHAHIFLTVLGLLLQRMAEQDRYTAAICAALPWQTTHCGARPMAFMKRSDLPAGSSTTSKWVMASNVSPCAARRSKSCNTRCSQASGVPSIGLRTRVPTRVTFQPFSLNASGGTIMAKFVLPQALGNAAATNVFCPLGRSEERFSRNAETDLESRMPSSA